MAKAPRRTASIDLLKDVELTAAGTNTWTFTMKRANVEISATYKKLLTNTDITVQGIAAVTYNGQAQEPTVTVQDGSTVLTLGTDYTVTYSNNTNAALSTAATAPTVTITGAGNYSGTVTKTFTIQKANITSLTAPTTEELTYNGGDQTLVIAGQVEGGTVVYSLDGQNYSADIPKGKDAGAYMVFYKVEPDANHDTNLAAQFVLQTIFKAPLTSLTLASTELVYNQQEQTPEISSVKAGEFIVNADDYTVSGSGTSVGTYMLTVTAKNSAKNFTGSSSMQYSIVPADASTKFTLTVTPESVSYDGTAMTPTVTVQDGNATLVEGTDYTVAYENNVNIGTATVTVTGKGNYTGTKTATFTIDMGNGSVVFSPWRFEKTYGDPNFIILPEVIGDGTLTYWSDNENILTVDENTGEVTIVGVGKGRIYAEISTGTLYIGSSDWYEVTVSPKALTEDMIGDIAEQNYTGEALTPEVVVSDGEAVLEESTDYTVAYADNTDLGQATVTVTGTGNYTGKVTKTFDIAMAQLTLDEVNDNSAELLDADGKWFDVTLKRTLSAGSWNTFAVPFDVETPDGWTVKSLESSSLEDGVLTLTFADAQGIEAGQPYLVKVEKDVDLSEQTFVGVKVSAESKPTETDGADLIPTLGKTAIEGEKESVLFLGAENKLYRPAELPADMKGFRAYFLLKGEAATAQEVRMDMGDDEITGINGINRTNEADKTFYDLNGRKVTTPTKKGVYIVNGKKVVVK